MSDLSQQIKALEAALDALAADSPARAGLEAMLAPLRAAQAPVAPHAGANLSGAKIERIDRLTGGDDVSGDKVLGDKLIQQFFHGQPGEDGERLLRHYLRAIIDENHDLRLGRMTERSQSGSGQALLPPLKLEDVYTSLVTDGPRQRVHERRYSATFARRILERLGRHSRDPNVVPPEQVREIDISSSEDADSQVQAVVQMGGPRVLDGLDDDAIVRFVMARPELAPEAMAEQRRLVLLGAPGSGKSTVLRYLTVLLARHYLDPQQHPPPFSANPSPVPLFCPLGLVASALADKQPGESDGAVFWRVLEAQLDGAAGLRAGLGSHLRAALRDGAAILLLDGLDELPASPGLDGRSIRARVSQAIQSAVRELSRSARVVVSCRVLPYQQAAADPRDEWRLPADDQWRVRTLQPFAFGQVRRFVQSWYQAACRLPAQLYSEPEGAARANSLLGQLERNPRLLVLTESPLLLTMLAILHYNKEAGELPRDRARLYDECVTLLLERWEPVRTPEFRKAGLLERLGIADRATGDDLRAVLHKVAFEAHNRPPDPGDGRGILRGSELAGELFQFFLRLRCDRIDERLAVFTEVLRKETGLLQEPGEDTYSFPHLTFQEFLAACYLANDPGMIKHAYQAWGSADGDRWREVLLLLVGRLRQQGKVETSGVPWLDALLRARTPTGVDKTPAQRWRDALLAADSYAEWDGRAALVSVDPDELERKLISALLPLLTVEAQLSSAERVHAGRYLGQLGDPRPEVSSLAPDWCVVPAGKFLLGSNPGDEGAYDDEQPQRTVELPAFRIARHPVSNAQWQHFIDAGGYSERTWWSAAGWALIEEQGWRAPRLWDDPRFNGANQPVVAVTWYEATAYCRWLSARLGYAVRLPSEAEWEKAARGADGRTYPWGDSWDAAKANTAEGRFGASTPIGCFPEGASPYGVQDMAGNVWEWTVTPWTENYSASDGTGVELWGREPGAAEAKGAEELYALRGGAWGNDQWDARCAVRFWNRPSLHYDFLGVRVVAALTQPGT